MAAQDTRATTEEAQANARTIAEIPDDQCPWPAVRAALIYRALAGYDCYAYTRASLTDIVEHPHDIQPRWTIWDRQANPWQEARFSPREWAIRNGFNVDSKEA